MRIGVRYPHATSNKLKKTTPTSICVEAGVEVRSQSEGPLDCASLSTGSAIWYAVAISIAWWKTTFVKIADQIKHVSEVDHSATIYISN